MSRYAAVIVGLFDDPDFSALSDTAQAMFLKLLTDTRRDRVGSLPVRYRRWAATSAGWDLPTVEKALAELEATGFVVQDEDDVLVRSWVRYDQMLRQGPKAIASVVTDFDRVISERFREVILAEVQRLLDDLDSSDSGKDSDAAERIRKGFGERLGKGSGEGLGDPSGEGPVEGPFQVQVQVPVQVQSLDTQETPLTPHGGELRSALADVSLSGARSASLVAAADALLELGATPAGVHEAADRWLAERGCRPRPRDIAANYGRLTKPAQVSAPSFDGGAL